MNKIPDYKSIANTISKLETENKGAESLSKADFLFLGMIFSLNPGKNEPKITELCSTLSNLSGLVREKVITNEQKSTILSNVLNIPNVNVQQAIEFEIDK